MKVYLPSPKAGYRHIWGTFSVTGTRKGRLLFPGSGGIKRNQITPCYVSFSLVIYHLSSFSPVKPYLLCSSVLQSNANTKHSTLSISYVFLFLWTLLWSNYIQSILWWFLTLLCCLFDFLLLVSHFWQESCQWRWERQNCISSSTDSWDFKQLDCGVASLEGPGQVRPRTALFLAPSGSWN